MSDFAFGFQWVLTVIYFSLAVFYYFCTFFLQCLPPPSILLWVHDRMSAEKVKDKTIRCWRFYIYVSTNIFEITKTSSLKGGTSPVHKKRAVNCLNMNWRQSKYLFCTTFQPIWTSVPTSQNGHARNIHRVRTTLRGGHWEFRFYGFRSVFSVLYKKRLGFSVLVSFAVCSLFYSALAFRFSTKNNASLFQVFCFETTFW